MMKFNKLSKMLVSVLLVFIFTLTACGKTGEAVVEVVFNQKVTVSFDYNCETTATNPQSVEIRVGDPYGTLPEGIENYGYVFAGWNTRADGTGKTVTASTRVNYTAGNHTLYALWQGDTFTVSFDLGGGNINGATTVSPRSVTYGEIYGMFAIPSSPQKYLAKFDGWFTNPEGNGTPVTMNSLVRVKGDHTLYAVFRDIRFSYKFTDPTEIKDFFSYGKTLNYEIVEDENGNYLEISNYSNSPSGYMVLSSLLTAGTKITIDAEFVGEVSPAELDDRDLDYDNKKVKAGMFCYGANSDGSGIGVGALGDPNNPNTPDIVKKWYWGQGARNDPWERYIWNNGKLNFTVNILEDCQGLQFMLEFGKKIVKEIPDANGVNYDTDVSLWQNNKWRIHSIEIDYAFPVPDLETGTEVKVNFDLNYETDRNSPASITAIAGYEIGELPEPDAREGYSFIGWNTSPDGKGKDYDPDRILLTPTEEITLYAIWEGETVKVSFDLNGGTYKGETQLMYEFVQLGVAYPSEILVSPSKEGYTFGGWFLNPEGSGNPVTENTIANQNGDHTLYAIYIKKVENINVFDFSDPTHALYFQALNGLTLGYEKDEKGGYLEVENNIGQPSGQIALMKPLTAGMTVDIDLEFIGEISDVDYTGDDKIRAGAFFYGAREDGWNLDKFTLGIPGAAGTPDHINKWYWGQGARNDKWEKGIWNDGHIVYTINILEDCQGISIYFEFGVMKDESGATILDKSLWENNKWRINSIVINVPGVQTEYGFELNGGTVDGNGSVASVQATTGDTYGTLPVPKKDGYTFVGWYLNANFTGSPVTSDTVIKNSNPHTLYAKFNEMRLNYDFTDSAQLKDFVNINGDARWEIVTDESGSYLKLVATNSNGAHFTISNMFLPAGSKVEFDVEFVGEYVKGDNSKRAGLFLYGANSNGYNITSGSLGKPGASGTPDEVNKWYWGQGYHCNDSSKYWNNGKFTITANILEDAYGVYVWAQMGSDWSAGYWKITAIRIELA